MYTEICILLWKRMEEMIYIQSNLSEWTDGGCDARSGTRAPSE